MRVFTIDRYKSEAPLITAFGIFGLIISLVFYPSLYWYSFLVFPILLVSYLIFRYFKLGIFKRSCFLILDDEGLRYCFHVFQQARSLKWEQVDKVNYQMYEINFKLKESGTVISFQTSYLKNEDEVKDLKDMITAKCVMM